MSNRTKCECQRQEYIYNFADNGKFVKFFKGADTISGAEIALSTRRAVSVDGMGILMKSIEFGTDYV